MQKIINKKKFSYFENLLKPIHLVWNFDLVATLYDLRSSICIAM